MPNAPMNGLHPYRPPGQCIYCGKKPPEVVLKLEHIVALGLGGDLLYPEASCDACGAVTGRFERRYMRDMHDGLRTFLGVFSNRRKKERRTSIPLKVWTSDQGDEHVETDLPPGEHPFWAAFFEFDPPAILSGAKPSETASIRVCRMAGHERYAPYSGQPIAVPGTYNSAWTTRTLAKMAHSCATAELGIGAFAPFLKSIILEDDFDKIRGECGKYVGGAEHASPYPTGNLHEIGLECRQVRGRFLVVVTIRLFSNVHETPTYAVVVGETWHRSFASRTASIQQR